MTPAERIDPDDDRRLAPHPHRQGLGNSVAQVNHLITQFGEMRKMMQQMGRMGSGACRGGLGKMAGLAARARRCGRARRRPPGRARGARLARPAPAVAGGGRNKKKKGGRVTPPKQR